MVQTLTSGVASCLSVVYSVVVLPEPVGPVTRMMPLARGHLLPARLVVARKTERAQIADQHLGVENPHHQLFAEGGRQRGQAQLDLLPGRRPRLDPAILRAALLDHVHAPEQLDAAGHGVHHRHRNLIHLMQHAVDAKTHDAQIAARLDVDVRGPLVEGVLPQPVDDMDDVLVVGVELAVALAEFDQLLEARQAGVHLAPSAAAFLTDLARLKNSTR
jgi:hypothetical protein